MDNGRAIMDVKLLAFAVRTMMSTRSDEDQKFFAFCYDTLDDRVSEFGKVGRIAAICLGLDHMAEALDEDAKMEDEG